jgi:hypothetical protein
VPAGGIGRASRWNLAAIRSFVACLAEDDMDRAEAHNSLNHGRIIRDHVERGRFVEFFEIENVKEDHQNGKVTLVLAQKEIRGSGFVMRSPGSKGQAVSP